MNDVIVPQNDVVRRQSAVPEKYEAQLPQQVEKNDFDENPFFKKGWKKSRESVKQHNKEDSRPLLWAFLVVVVLVGGFSLANYFARATVEITPIIHNIHIDQNLAAVKDVKSGELVFEFMSIEEIMTKDVPATIKKEILKKASGKVIIYNAYSKDNQRLIKNTRLEAPDHRIYRIDESVVVPGAKVSGGKIVEPGFVEAVIYADGVGDKYEIPADDLKNSDFTIPGFKGDPRYNAFYAKRKPNVGIIGGYEGVVKVPSDEAIATAIKELEDELRILAYKKADSEVPEGMSFFPGSMVIKFEEIQMEDTTTDTAEVSRRAKIFVFFFDTVALTEKLSVGIPVNDHNGIFEVKNMSVLTFKLDTQVSNVMSDDLSKINFHIVGDANFEGQIDQESIRTSLLRKNKKDFGLIIGTQSNIDTANAIIRPLWKTVFPGDPKKITIRILEK